MIISTPFAMTLWVMLLVSYVTRELCYSWVMLLVSWCVGDPVAFLKIFVFRVQKVQ